MNENLSYFHRHARQKQTSDEVGSFASIQDAGPGGLPMMWKALLSKKLKEFFINRMVKSARRFNPGKSVQGVTIYHLCMTSLESMLVVHARKVGPLDPSRIRVLMAVRGHFDEHVMFRQYPSALAESIFTTLSSDYDRMTAHVFVKQYEEFTSDTRPILPELVKELILQHLAMFQRVDVNQLPELQRRADIRDAHGLLLGSVTEEAIDKIMRYAAGYTIDPRWA
jgi:hypothetical protein